MSTKKTRTRRSPEQRLADLEAKEAAQLERAKQTKLEADKIRQAMKKKERARDNQRCIIGGRYALQHLEANPDSDFAKTMIRLLDEYVTNPEHRKHFADAPYSLAPKADKAKARGKPSNDTGKLATQFPAEPEGRA